MVTWQLVEEAVERAVGHFAAVARIATPDQYATDMALRHAIQCGSRELAEALSLLQRLHRKGAGFSLLSDECRRAYLALRALEYEELVAPSDIYPVTFQESVAAAGVLSESLQADFERIKQELRP